ncbi:unnamed protein product [Closterium sp. NIES-53]
MDAEMASWKSTGTYVDEVPPSRANIVDGMWIFRVKRPLASPPAFKARYVARGFSQRQGVDYFQTFSPTPKMTTLGVFLHVAAQRDYELHSLDFSTAFLQGSSHEEIWLRRPPRFTGTFPAVLVYVDDLVFATADTEAMTIVKSELQKRHTCTDLGELRSYLGLQIMRDRARCTVTLTQSHMMHQVLQRFGFQFSSPQPTPLSTSHSLSAPPSDESVEPSGPYPELVGCLITTGMGLVLGGRGPIVLTGHADASWVDDSATQWSSQGYTFSLGSGSVSWRSTCSSLVLSSNCEAEIYPGAMAAQELRWLTYLLTDLGEQPRSPLVLCVATRANTADVFTKALLPGDHQRFATVLGLWLTHNAVARLAIRNHLLLAERAHFGHHKTAKSLYDAVVTRYSSPATAALGRLILPYLFPELSAFATVEDLVTHLRTSVTCYCAALPAEFLDRNPPPMYITLYFSFTHLPDSLRTVRDHFLALDPTELTVDLLEKNLLAAKTSVVAVGAAPIPPRTPFFEGCSPSALAPSYASAATIDILGAEDVDARNAHTGIRTRDLCSDNIGALTDVGAASSLSGKRCSGKGKVGKSGGSGSGGGGGGGSGGGGGGGGCGSGDCGGGSGGFGGGGGGSSGGGGGGSGGSGSGGGGSGGEQGGAVQRGGFWRWLEAAAATSERDPVAPAAFAEGDCYLSVPPDPGIEAAALGASESALHGTALVEALHTFKLDSDASHYFFRDSTTLTPLPVAVPVSAPGLVAAPCSCRLLSHQNLLWHHRLGHPSLPRLLGMLSRLLFSSLPRSLAPLPPSPAPPCLPCVEGQQRAAPHSSSFPLSSAPLQTLHMDVWGPARVSGQDRARYFLLDLPVLRLHSDRGGEFSSNLLRDFCHGEGILQSFMLPDSPQKNGIAERRFGLVMEVARTSMIHAAAPHFLWPFAVRYAAHQLNLWPRLSLPETSPALRWTGKVGDALVFRFYHPTSCRVHPSQDVMPDELVPIYRLFPYRAGPLPPRRSSSLQVLLEVLRLEELCLGVAFGGAEPVSAEPRGAEPEGVEPGGAVSEGVESGGAETRAGGSAAGGTEAGGAGAAGPRGGRTSGTGAAGAGGVGGAGAGDVGAGGSGARGTGSGGAGAGGTGAGAAGASSPRGAGVIVGAGGSGGAGAAGPGGARTRGTRAAGAGGVGGAGAGDPGAGDTRAVGAGAGGAKLETLELEALALEALELEELELEELEIEALELEALELEALELETLDLEVLALGVLELAVLVLKALCSGVRFSFHRSRRLCRHLTWSSPVSSCLSCLRCSHWRRVPCPRPAPVPGTHIMAIPRAAGPTVPRLLATVVTDPSFESTVASALVAKLVDFAAAYRLNYATSLVAEPESECPLSIKGECALGTDVLEDSVLVLEVASVSSSSVGARPRRQQLREWFLRGAFGGSCPYVIRTGDHACQTCGRLHTQPRCFSRLDDAWHAEFGDNVELPQWADLLRSRIAIFDLDFNAILFAMYALSASAEGDCYQCVPPDLRNVIAALGASESGSALRCFFRDSTTLTPLPAPIPGRLADPSGGPVVARSSTVLHCPAVPSGSLSGLHLPSFSANLVSTVALQDAMVTTTTPGGVRVRSGSSLLLASPPVAPDSTVAPPPGSPLPATPSWHALSSSSRVSGQSRECFFLLVVDDYTWYTTVFPLRSKGQVVDVLIPWTRTVRLQLRERFGQDLSVVRLHSDRGGEFSSNLLREFCRGEGILQSFRLPASPQQNGIAERRIGLVMEVAHTSMIHAAAPHFQWPFAVQYAAHQLNLWPRVSLPETSPTLCWTGEVGDASVFRVWGSRAFVRDTFAEKLSPRAIPCVFLGFDPDALGWQFYHPTLRRVFPSQDVTFDESVPFYRLFPYCSAPPPPPPLFLAPGPPPVDPLLPQGPAPSGVSQVDPLRGPAPVQVAVDSGAARGAAYGGAGSGGAEPGGAESEGAETGGGEHGGAEPEGIEPGGASSEGAESGGAEPQGAALSGGSAGASLRLSPQQLREWFVRGARLQSGATGAAGAGAAGAGGAGVAAGAGVTGGTATSGPGGACTRGTGAAGSGGVEGPGARDPTDSGATGAGGSGAGGAGAGRAGVGGTSAGGTGVGGPCVGGAGAGGAGAVDPGGTMRPRFWPLQCPLLVLEDRQEDFECLAAAVPRFASMLLSPEGDPDAPDILTPRSYAVAITVPYSSQWQAAMDAEMASWKFTDTYVDAVPPSRANIVDGIWNFRVKRPLGSSPAFKARYVARGFTQKGVDYFQTFSHTPKMTTFLVLLHVTAQRDYELHSLEFSTAFLQGSLHEEIWLCRPPGFTGSFPAGTQWSLQRLVYGLHQAPCEWHDIVRTTLAALGFDPATADPSLFLRTDTSLPSFYVLVYVDDLVFATADTKALTLVKSELQKRHTYTDLGELCSYLGLQITRDRARRTNTLTQSHMVHQVLQRFGFQFSSPQPTPLSTSHSLSAPPSDESVEPSGLYPELVGCLMYLMTCTRPDLMYPLSLPARYVAPGRHRKVHWDAAKRVLRYLCSTSGMGLVLGGRGTVFLTSHANASWVDDLATQQSSQGYTFSLGYSFVSWRSTRSSSVLSSSCEAEIYAGAMAAQELRWLTYLLTDSGEEPCSPPVLYVDNKAMIALCQEHRLEHRMKHIALRYFLARELQQGGQFHLVYVTTRVNTADIFTKALQSGDHQRFSTILVLVPNLPHLLTA